MAVIVMLKIAIVDDEKLVCSEIMGMLKKYEIEKSITFKIYSYLSGENLICEIEDGTSFDIIFLDIELESINGVQVGEYIRSICNDQRCQIIYVSSKTKYALQLFKIRPFDFIIKPVTYEKVKNCLEEYVRIYSVDEYFECITKKQKKSISINDIIYFESIKRKFIVHGLNFDCEFYGKMQELLDDRRLRGFLLIHQSFLININHIITYEYNSVEMTGGVILTISKSNRKDVRRKILEYSADKIRKKE